MHMNAMSILPMSPTLYNHDGDDMFSNPSPVEFKTSSVMVEDMEEVNVSGTIFSVPKSLVFHLETLPSGRIVIQQPNPINHVDDCHVSTDVETAATTIKNKEDTVRRMIHIDADPKLFTWILHWLRWNSLPEEEAFQKNKSEREALHSLALVLGLEGLVLHFKYFYLNNDGSGSGDTTTSETTLKEVTNTTSTPSRSTTSTPSCRNTNTNSNSNTWKKRRITAAAAVLSTPTRLDLARALCGSKKRTTSSPWSHNSNLGCVTHHTSDRKKKDDQYHFTISNQKHIPFYELGDTFDSD